MDLYSRETSIIDHLYHKIGPDQGPGRFLCRHHRETDQVLHLL